MLPLSFPMERLWAKWTGFARQERQFIVDWRENRSQQPPAAPGAHLAKSH
jgi:hypothetical protein